MCVLLGLGNGKNSAQSSAHLHPGPQRRNPSTLRGGGGLYGFYPLTCATAKGTLHLLGSDCFVRSRWQEQFVKVDSVFDRLGELRLPPFCRTHAAIVLGRVQSYSPSSLSPSLSRTLASGSNVLFNSSSFIYYLRVFPASCVLRSRLPSSFMRGFRLPGPHRKSPPITLLSRLFTIPWISPTPPFSATRGLSPFFLFLSWLSSPEPHAFSPE